MSTAARLLLGPADQGRALTLEEYEDAEFEGEGLYELSRGVLDVVHIAEEYPHGMILDFLMGWLYDYRRTHPDRIHRIGGGSEFRIYLPTMASDRHPDIAVALKATPKDPLGRRPPSLAIEIVSPGAEARRRDYVLKREEYLAYGLLEYWIVDPEERRVTVLLRQDGRWIERVFQGEQAAEGLVLPGLRVPLPELWSSAEDRDVP